MKRSTLARRFGVKRLTRLAATRIEAALAAVEVSLTPSLEVSAPGTWLTLIERSPRRGASAAEITDLARQLQAASRRSADALQETPHTAGVYAWWIRKAASLDLGLKPKGVQTPFYIGMTKNLRQRLSRHLSPPKSGAFLGPHLALWLRLAYVSKTLPPFVTEGGPLSAYTASALRSWMRNHLEFSYVRCSDANQARELERQLIRDARPLSNLRDVEPPEDWTAWIAEMSDVPEVPAQALWDFEWDAWARERHSLLAGLGSHEALVVWYGDDFCPTRWRRARSGDAAGPRRVIVQGRWFRNLRRAAIAARPDQVYSVPMAERFGDPPPWEEVVTGLSDQERRALILRHRVTLPEHLQVGQAS